MDFLLEFNEFINPILEHYYDSVVNSYLGLPASNKNALTTLINYILQMIDENQIKDVIKEDDTIDFTIKNRKFKLNKSGVLTLYKTRTDSEEIKNIDVLRWIFGNEEEAQDVLNTSAYKGKIRTIGSMDTPELRKLNMRVGKKSDEDFLKNFKTPKKYSSKELSVDIPIDKGICLKIFNQISSI